MARKQKKVLLLNTEARDQKEVYREENRNKREAQLKPPAHIAGP
jgi:hypothetical protein